MPNSRFTVEGCSAQDRRKGNNVNVISGKETSVVFKSSCSIMLVRREKINGDCIERELLKVEVPIAFLGTVGFSAHRKGHQDCLS